MSAAPETAAAPASHPRQGILFLITAMFFFVVMDTFAKHLIKEYSLVQVVWGRYFFHFAMLTLLLAPRLNVHLRTKNLPLQLIRSLLLFVTTALFFLGLRYISLADAAAVFYITPIIVTALSMPVLKERVGPRRWAGVLIGFLGALIIIKPGTGAMQAAILLPLAAAFTYAFYQLSTRFLSQADPVLTTLYYTAMTGTVACSLAVPFFWSAPDLLEWGLLAGLGIMGGIGHFALIKAFTVAPAATVVPFTYTNMIWALSLGYVVFGDLPDPWTLVGAALIAASGLYILHRETTRGLSLIHI